MKKIAIAILMVLTMGVESTVLMVRPVQFGFNQQTAGTNAFQKEQTLENVQAKALAEFDHYVQVLRQHNVEVLVFQDTKKPITPDSIFPNNWISVHPDGKLLLYPMMAPNRRAERRQDIIDTVHGVASVWQTIDMTVHEKRGVFLEGTGSIVYDHPAKKAYACLSPRTNKELFELLCADLGYEPITFVATDAKGKKIYHTNVLMDVGKTQAVICSEAIENGAERAKVLQSLQASGRQVVEISREQMDQFCGNVLEITDREGNPIIAMSDTAYNAFTEEQRQALAKGAKLLHVPLKTIETVGGGGARCMLALIHDKENTMDELAKQIQDLSPHYIEHYQAVSERLSQETVEPSEERYEQIEQEVMEMHQQKNPALYNFLVADEMAFVESQMLLSEYEARLAGE